MDTHRAAELHELADNLRAALECAVEGGEWAASGPDATQLGAEARGRMIAAGEMARRVIGAPDQIDGMVAMCGAYSVQSVNLRGSLAQAVQEKSAAADEHAAYRESKESEVADLRQRNALLKARCRASPAAAGGRRRPPQPTATTSPAPAGKSS